MPDFSNISIGGVTYSVKDAVARQGGGGGGDGGFTRIKSKYNGTFTNVTGDAQTIEAITLPDAGVYILEAKVYVNTSPASGKKVNVAFGKSYGRMATAEITEDMTLVSLCWMVTAAQSLNMDLNIDAGTETYSGEYAVEVYKYVGGAHEYSTSEKVVGEWIDGKPIYEKTIDCGTLPQGSSAQQSVKLVDISDLNVSAVITCYGFAKHSTANMRYRFLPFIDNSNVYNNIRVDVDDNGTSGKCYVRLLTSSDWSAYNAYATIRYTKTTD